MLSRVDQVRTLDLPTFSRDDGTLVVAESPSAVPFAIQRIFTIQAPRGAKRGEHAHRRCAQFIICVHGAVNVACDDSERTCNFSLCKGNIGLYVPPTIWTTIEFEVADSSVLVLCDRLFEEADYLRFYDQFLAYRKNPEP